MAFPNKDSLGFKDNETASKRVVAKHYYQESECKMQKSYKMTLSFAEHLTDIRFHNTP